MKTMKTTIAALVLTVAPMSAFAMGCNYGNHTPTTAQISCAEGLTLDAATGTCVPLTTG